MSYTNWETAEKLFMDYGEFNYFLNLSDEIKDIATSILPYPIKSIEDIKSSYLETFINTLQGFINTVKIVNGDIENTTNFNITEIPNRINFIACYAKEYDVKTKQFDSLVCVCESDLMTFYESNSNESNYIVSINPNIARLCKLSIGFVVDDINTELQSSVFINSVGYKLTSIYRKNMGYYYDKSKLKQSEIEASGNWLTKELQNELMKVIKAFAPNTNSCTSPIYASGCILMALKIIEDVQSNLDKYVGYEYTNEYDFTFNYSKIDYIKQYLDTHSTEMSNRLLIEHGVYEIVESRILEVMTSQDFYENSIESQIECLIIDILNEKGIRAFNDLPINYQALVREYDITLSQLLEIMLQRTMTESPIADKIGKSKLKGYYPNHMYDFVEYANLGNTLTIYPVNHTIASMTLMTKILQQRCNLVMSEMKQNENLFVNDIEDVKLRLEASTVYYVLDKDLVDNVGGVFTSCYDYKVAMRQYKLPINELIKIVKVTKE